MSQRIKAIIVEDERGPRESLKAILREYIPDVKVVAEAIDIKSGIETIKKKETDILFLDIRLPDGESFEILDQFPNAKFEVIFITAYSDYLQKAFDYFSFQYLTKPLDIEKLEKTIERFRKTRLPNYSREKLKDMEEMVQEKEALLKVPHSDGFQIFKVRDMLYLEAKGSYTKIVTTDGTSLLTTKGLSYYEGQLNSQQFYRTHKSYLVNIDKVNNFSFEEGIALENNFVVPLAQRKRKEFFKYMNEKGLG